jgi:hypothetical protein
MTPLAPGEITQPLIAATSLYLGCGMAVWFIADVLMPWPPVFKIMFAAQPWLGLGHLWQFGFPFVMLVSQLATARMASAWCTRAALEPATAGRPGESDIWNWLGALVFMGAAMFGMLLAMMIIYIIFTAALGLTSYRDFVYLSLFTPLYQAGGVALFLFILSAVTLPAKFLIARFNARRAKALLLDEQNIQ